MTAEPQRPPEMLLIQQRREDRVPRLSMREAARRAGISSPWWRVLETGIRRVKGQNFAEKANAETLARMAMVVGATPAELAEAGRPDAAQKLVKLIEAGPSPGQRLAAAIHQSRDLNADQKAYLTELVERESR